MENEKNIIVLGSINYDLMITVDRMPQQGETIHGHSYLESIGGKGSNQAVAAAKLGAHTTLVGAVGNDFYGKLALEEIGKEGVITNHINKSTVNSTGTAFIISSQSDNRIIVNEGANGELNNNYVKIIKNSEKNNIFLAQLENPVEDVEKAIMLANDNDLITILNPAPAKELSKNIFKKIDYFIVNQPEAEFYTGIYPFDEESYIKVAYKLIDMGVSNVVITLGSKGCFFMNSTEKKYLPGFKINAVDSTGAGDTFIGGFVYGLSQNLNVEKCLEYGNAAGALSCMKYGAKSSMPNRHELEAFIENNIKQRSATNEKKVY